jgi:hypothetical protein
LAVVLVKVSLIPPNGTAVVETAAWLMPGINALLYVKPAPAVALAGVYVKVDPLQIADGVNVLVKTGIGLTSTTTFCELLQPPALVVTA